MIDKIQDFIASKSLSANSRAAYFYDLQQFAEVIDSRVTKEKLALYEQSLADLKISAKKRKLSAVNQFLHFLYETGQADRFYKLANKEKIARPAPNQTLLDLDLFYQDCQNRQGQLIALLILELGLLPREIQTIKMADIDRDFAVLRLQKSALLRILELPQRLLPYLETPSEQLYLFDRKGQVYSRQWLFYHLKAYLQEIGQLQLTAQELRQQFILRKKEEGKSISELAQMLGLKRTTTLEKYYQNGY